jgi:hypothetical protein
MHGFNCDATPERYNKAAADLAWQRTIDWFNKYLVADKFHGVRDTVLQKKEGRARGMQ